MIDTEGKLLVRGSRVELTSPAKSYHIGDSNPLKGTKYACIGTYIGNCRVMWDNKTTNNYSNEELTIVDDHCEDIWSEI